ncbi:hypothetical protein [Pseudacidovorax intermedius]|nr:hypothetical protein [Pseudacidovorax intermedius]
MHDRTAHPRVAGSPWAVVRLWRAEERSEAGRRPAEGQACFVI